MIRKFLRKFAPPVISRFPRQHSHHKTRPRVGGDLMSVIIFSEGATEYVPPMPPWEPRLALAIDRLPNIVGGNTNIASALRLALHVSRTKCPPGSRRRIFLLSDGEPTTNEADTLPAARAVRDAHINLNCLAFGEAAGSKLLRSLAEQTHRGRFISVANLHEMAAALRNANVRSRREHRQEVAIVLVDVSGSMSTRDFGNQSRIEAVRDALKSLATYKAMAWA